MFKSLRRIVKTYYTKAPLKVYMSNDCKNLCNGQRISVRRTIAAEDVTKFAELTGDYNPVHIDIPQKIVHGALLNGFLSGVLGTKLPGPGTIVVEQLIRYPKPCYIGDDIEISVEIVSVRKIIKCKYWIVANHKTMVLEGDGKFILGPKKVVLVA